MVGEIFNAHIHGVIKGYLGSIELVNKVFVMIIIAGNVLLGDLSISVGVGFSVEIELINSGEVVALSVVGAGT